MAVATPPVLPAQEPPTLAPAAATEPTPHPSREVVLRCSGLRKRFGDRIAVDGIGFEIGRGETYGLLGPNGAGKTTTISMVCGDPAPRRGRDPHRWTPP